MMAFLFLPYFQHISIFQNTNVLPQNTAEPQYPTGCIINEQERESILPPSYVTHSPCLSYSLPEAIKEAATSCCALWKFEGSSD